MAKSVILDTGFLISLGDGDRSFHKAAVLYYEYFLKNQITMYLSTIVIGEFSVKEDIQDTPLRNFTILPFNYNDAVKCGNLNAIAWRKHEGIGQRDFVKDDFKIIAQAVVNDIDFLITEDNKTMRAYCETLRSEKIISFEVISISEEFDVSLVNEDKHMELNLPKQGTMQP